MWNDTLTIFLSPCCSSSPPLTDRGNADRPKKVFVGSLIFLNMWIKKIRVSFPDLDIVIFCNFVEFRIFFFPRDLFP